MRPTNLENPRTIVNIPLELKRNLYEDAKREGLPLNGFILQILWSWERKKNEQGDDTGCTA